MESKWNSFHSESNQPIVHCLRCHTPQKNLSTHLARVCMRNFSPTDWLAEVRRAKERVKNWTWVARTWNYGTLCTLMPDPVSRWAMIRRMQEMDFFIPGVPGETDLQATCGIEAPAAIAGPPENLGLYARFPPGTSTIWDFREYLMPELREPVFKQEWSTSPDKATELPAKRRRRETDADEKGFSEFLTQTPQADRPKAGFPEDRRLYNKFSRRESHLLYLKQVKEEQEEVENMQQELLNSVTEQASISRVKTEKSSSDQTAEDEPVSAFLHSGDVSFNNSSSETHTGEKPFTSHHSDQTFSSEETLQWHLQAYPSNELLHNPVEFLRKHTCPECDKTFTSENSLNVHMRTHTGEKPFSCSLCGRSFSQKGHLKIHMRIHTGEKPYICSQCGKSFKTKAELTVHMRSHTGERPFSCPQCPKKFSYKSGFNYHIAALHGLKLLSQRVSQVMNV